MMYPGFWCECLLDRSHLEEKVEDEEIIYPWEISFEEEM
jgi:hypothetical protein